ncbi:uncharacterized protein LOC143881393 [Tasmannia lanceolata]|uniref:uncharacterized protein LOC143881393 n=1 Tax=Tasmannia lanceolata TaxID=3420 RepID=UPI004062DBD3
MMNLVALCLVISSLVSAGVWSPVPENQLREEPTYPKQDLIIKEGHRVIVVEYEREGIRKPIEDPSLTHVLDQEKPTLDSAEKIAEEKFKEGASHIPNLRQGLSVPTHESLHKTGEKIKDKITGAFDKTKETVSDKVTHVKEEAKLAGEKVNEKIIEKAKEAEEVAEKAVREGRENLTMIFRRGRDVIYDGFVYSILPEYLSLLMGLVHLLAFSVSYGMCVWVTFISSHVLSRALPRQQFGVVQSKIYPVYFRAMTYCVGVAFLAHLFNQRLRNVDSQAEKFQCYNMLVSLGVLLTNMLYFEPRATKVMFERLKMEKEEGKGRDMADMVEPVSTPPTARTTSPAGVGGGARVCTAASTTTVTPGTDGGGARTFRTNTGGRVTDEEEVKSRVGKLNQRLRTLNSYSSFLNVMTLMSLTWHLVYLAQRLEVSC